MLHSSSDLLTSELTPKRRDDLAINKTKVNELSQWLKQEFSSSKNGTLQMLYLTGPTGSGKSTCVEVLCNELHIELIDYTPERLHNENLEYENADSTQLLRFLVRRHTSFQKSIKQRVLMISELPDQAYRDPDVFRAELSEVRPNVHHPVIFCLSNGVGNWKFNPDRIFNESFLHENNIQQINFNPVAFTFIAKALQRASSVLRMKVSDHKCNTIAAEAQGDLRLAVNMLQVNQNPAGGAHLISASMSNREETFHMIGRILYAKRSEHAPEPNKRKTKKRKSDRVEATPGQRFPLEHDPTDIITMSSMSANTLTNFLFENELAFCSDLSKYRKVADTFSLCDVIGSDWDVRRSLPDEYESQIATRSVMWENFEGPRPSRLYQMRRPLLSELNKELSVVKNKLQSVPMIEAKYFFTLLAPYRTLIKRCRDPNRLETFLARPFTIIWKYGRDRIVDQMEHWRSARPVIEKPKRIEKKTEEKEAEPEETWTIEDSSDDSFDDF